MTKRNGILHVTTSVPPLLSGNGRYALELCKHHAEMDVRSAILTFGDDDAIEHYDGYDVVRVRTRRIGETDYPLLSLRFIRCLDKMLKSSLFRTLVTHTRFYLSSTIAQWIGSVNPNISVIHVEHGASHLVHPSEGMCFLSRAYDHMIAERSLRMVSGCVAVGPSSASFLRHIGYAGQMEIVPNSTTVADNKFEPPLTPKASTVNILFAGRLTISKGIDTLLSAFNNLGDLDVKLTIAGSGPDADLVMEARSGRMSSRIEYLGQLDDIQDALARSHIVVVPSKYDSLPSVLLEACARGKRVVASRVGDIPYVLGDEYKYLFSPGDVTELSQKLRQAATNEDYSDSNLANRIASDFSWDKSAKRFLAFIDRLNG